MNILSERGTAYQSPSIDVIEINPEGVLCQSGDPTESLDENLGSW